MLGTVEMQFAATYLLVIRLLCAIHSQVAITKILDWLDTARQHALLGIRVWEYLQKLQPGSLSQSCPSLEVLRSFAIAAYLRGEALSLPLRSIQIQLRAVVRRLRAAHHLYIGLCIKIGVVTTLAFIGRIGVLIYLSRLRSTDLHPDDRALLTIGLALTVVVLVCIKRQLPKPWLWQRGFTATGINWLECELTGRSHLPGWWGEAWRNLSDRELFLGLNLTKDKSAILADWLLHLESEQALRLAIFESTLPLFEILIAGGLALLILLHPVLIVCNQ